MAFHPRVSVIVPTHNRISSLLEVVSSIANQTYPVVEIIVADNGSTDGSREALVDLGIQELKVLTLENSGRPSTARNAGLAVAQGDWIAFCDSDDYWSPKRLEAQIEARLPSTRAICSNAWVMAPQSEARHLAYRSLPNKLGIEELLKKNVVINSSVLIERELLLQIGGIPDAPSLKFVEDYAAWLRVAFLSPFQVINEPLLTYTDDLANSIRGEQPFEHVMTGVIAWVDFLAWMRSRGKPLSFSEKAIDAALPRLIATNLRMISKN